MFQLRETQKYHTYYIICISLSIHVASHMVWILTNTVCFIPLPLLLTSYSPNTAGMWWN